MDTSSISFTALYTGQVWYENGLSAPFFKSPRGRLMYLGMQPLEKVAELAVGTNLRHLLLQRHHIMDYRIQQLIEAGACQILEIACGLSPRGYAFTQRYPDLHYIEADLPGMAKRKQTLLEQKQAFGKHHKVISCNILESGAPQGLDYILRNVLDPDKPTIVITEGLVNYFTLETITPFWQTLVSIGKEYKSLTYLTDCYPVSKRTGMYKWINLATKTLGTITRAEVDTHFENEQAVQDYFSRLGFTSANVYKPEDYYNKLDIPRSRGQTYARVLEARV